MIKLTKINLKDNIKQYNVSTDYLKIQFLNIGAAIYRLETKDQNGQFSNIILSLPSPLDYLNNDAYYGVVVGRNAGRIKRSKHKLLKNLKWEQDINLHSNGQGLSWRILESKAKVKNNKAIISFWITIKEKDDGFPGDINIEVTYKVFDNELLIEYRAQANKDTICNLTNHTYFNLNTKNKDILNHNLLNTFKGIWILDHNNLPKKIVSSKELFNNVNNIQDLLSNNPNIFANQKGINHPFITNNIFLDCKDSGRNLSVSSSYPIINLYSQNYSNSFLNKTHMGLAIEFQYLPNDINISKNKSPTILRKDHKYNQWVRYKFNEL